MDRARTIAFQRLRRQDGMGLVELLIAMTILVVGIMAIVAAFGSGAVALQRASRVSTAGTIADAQMEAYRALNYAAIKLDDVDSDGAGPDSSIPISAPYTTDVACGGACDASSQLTGGSATCAAALATDPACPSRTTTGADLDSYRVDVYITWTCALGTLRTSGTYDSITYTPTAPGCLDAVTNAKLARPGKLVTIVVRDGTTPTEVLLRESSSFEQALG